MSPRFITNATDSPTDNFKINVNKKLKKPFGDFLEDIHIWVDEERTRLNLPDFQWFLSFFKFNNFVTSKLIYIAKSCGFSISSLRKNFASIIKNLLFVFINS